MWLMNFLFQSKTPFTQLAREQGSHTYVLSYNNQGELTYFNLKYAVQIGLQIKCALQVLNISHDIDL